MRRDAITYNDRFMPIEFDFDCEEQAPTTPCCTSVVGGESDEHLLILANSISLMSARDQRIMMLRLRGAMSVVEIAQQLQLSLSAAKSASARAVKRLRRSLARAKRAA